MTPDVNVLVAASRADHPHYQIARQWLEGALGDTGGRHGSRALADGDCRISEAGDQSTSVSGPNTDSRGDRVVDAILAHEHVVLGTLGGEWSVLRDACIDGKLSGNAIPDAWIAAAVRNLQTTLVTFDRDFVRLLLKHELEILQA